MLSNQLGVLRLMHLNFVRSYVPRIISGELKLTFYDGNPFLINPLNNSVYDCTYYVSGRDDFRYSDEEDLIAIVSSLIAKCEMFYWWVNPQNIITHELFEDEVNDFMYAQWEKNKAD